MKKLLAVVIALAMVIALAAPVFAAEEYTVALLYADADWYPNLMSNDDPAAETCPKITITGDGTYSIETDAAAGASGIMVLCVDLRGVAAAHPDATVTLDSIEVDGAPFEFDASKIVYGDIEENGNLRIEIYNEYGSTKSDAPFLAASLNVKSTFKVTFTVAGIGTPETEAAPTESAESEAAPAESTDAESETTAPTETANDAPETAKAPKTGLALAVVPAVVAMAAAVISKRR